MKKSRTAQPSVVVESPAVRSLPLVELLVDTKADLFELMVRSGLQVLKTADRVGDPVCTRRSPLGHACVLSTFGRFDESTAEMRRTVELDPLHVNWRGVLMAHLVCAGRHEEALHEGRRALDVAQNEIHPHLAMPRPIWLWGTSTPPRFRGESAS